MINSSRLWLNLLAVTAAGPGAGTARTADDLAEAVIRGIVVVDVRRGVVLPARDVMIRGTRIGAVQPSGGALPPAKTIIEGRGKFAGPRLIDPHVRLGRFTRASVAALLVERVTAVRDIGTEPGRLAEWRRALAHGQMYAPRVARTCGAEPGCGDALAAPPALAAVIRARGPVGAGHAGHGAAVVPSRRGQTSDSRGAHLGR